ncbi:BRCT domain-containing protein At4g02110 [Diospyros lotus]|uniref:BRCT domain-containing protein At4g02110 n=1 Tax=Diospyros lotus TaxID=55363 RepID=UPI00224EC2C8|nr:BRCT domain-containing protein At4g02110 [Diospyros lotus]
MLGPRRDSPVQDHHSETFTGIRFVLLGFDAIQAEKFRLKLVSGGGVDFGLYDPSCTHVIVDKLTYDDPVCVAARADGKILVTGLWVDHSCDIGMPADPTSVMYIPLRELSGIPGAKSLTICLTGYLSQDRDDIMTMVGLVGAKFSKPLVANKVTHLICYKFEGEKYELAKKMRKIKLVNHLWLEDSLRAWEILPEADYNKSGYELEMEIEVKDSVEEAQNIAEKQYDAISGNMCIGRIRGNLSSQLKEDISRKLLATSASKVLTADEIVSVHASNLQDVHKNHSKVFESWGTRTPGDVASGKQQHLSKTYSKKPASAQSENVLTSKYEDAVRADTDGAKFSISYSRKIPKRNTLPMSSSAIEQAIDVTNSSCVKTPLKETKLHHERGQIDAALRKRKMDVSYGSSKSRKITHDSTISQLVNDAGGLASSGSLSDELDNWATPGPNPNSPSSNSSALDRTSMLKPIVGAVNSKDKQKYNLDASQTSFTDMKKMSLASRHSMKDVMNNADNPIGEVGKPQEELHDVQVPGPETKLEAEKSSSLSLNLFKGQNVDSILKPLRRKVVGKKVVGRKSKLLGPGNTKNQKCPVYVSKTVSQPDIVATSIDGKQIPDKVALGNYKNLNLIPLDDVDGATMMETNNVAKAGNEVEIRTGSMVDETEAPEDKERELEAVNLSHKMTIGMKYNTDAGEHIAIGKNASSSSANHPPKTSDDGKGGELEKPICGGKNGPDQLVSKEDAAKEKITRRKKALLGKTSRKLLPGGMRKSKVDDDRDKKGGKNNGKIENEEEKSILHPTCETKQTLTVEKSENSIGVDKGNSPAGILDKNVSQGKRQFEKVALRSNKLSTKIELKPGLNDPDSVFTKRILKVKTEPEWFILSGHKLQRKEFQQVIRRLKGRVCRDSHQWSYQATHFIVPDPLRRTEKLFAAAASGRWILKTDYLTTSSQAGRFLAEEPYEWHKKGLSEDGAINLEAPRKWRLLRERTGHGAFYGMRILIYGDCIAPPLDTLKRVIKAGNGTILATSPPYTRFLKSGVDFAVISPGMPRVDRWVQEFLRHETPCVVADYLVEYVCKPGYSLERHVQHNTHTWAERSMATHLSRLEEVVEEPTTPQHLVLTDLPCQGCGCRDRGEDMLICGNESGSAGCGIGMHIDCCNPPLEYIPEEDWFCPNCSKSSEKAKRPKTKSTKARRSSVKSK